MFKFTSSYFFLYNSTNKKLFSSKLTENKTSNPSPSRPSRPQTFPHPSLSPQQLLIPPTRINCPFQTPQSCPLLFKNLSSNCPGPKPKKSKKEQISFLRFGDDQARHEFWDQTVPKRKRQHPVLYKKQPTFVYSPVAFEEHETLLRAFEFSVDDFLFRQAAIEKELSDV